MIHLYSFTSIHIEEMVLDLLFAFESVDQRPAPCICPNTKQPRGLPVAEVQTHTACPFKSCIEVNKESTFSTSADVWCSGQEFCGCKKNSTIS